MLGDHLIKSDEIKKLLNCDDEESKKKLLLFMILVDKLLDEQVDWKVTTRLQHLRSLTRNKDGTSTQE
jgi:hypothetical protein